jgi:thymidylate kinase
MSKEQNIIILEGPDCCGKTNIAHELSRIFEIPYFKNTNEWEYFEKDDSYFLNALKYSEPFNTSFFKQTGTSVILDRSYPSEFVYSRLFNRDTDLELLKKIDIAYSELGTKIIIPTRTSYVGLIDQFGRITEDVLVRADKLYTEFSKWTACDVFVLNVDDENLSREIKEITSFLKINK